MFYITRSPDKSPGKSIVLYPDANIDPNMTVAEFFADGGFIQISVEDVDREENRVELGIEVPPQFTVVRDELMALVAAKGENE